MHFPRFQGGWQSIIPPPRGELRGGGGHPLDFYKVITPNVLDLEQVIFDHRQVGQPGKNGDAPKEACLNF